LNQRPETSRLLVCDGDTSCSGADAGCQSVAAISAFASARFNARLLHGVATRFVQVAVSPLRAVVPMGLIAAVL